VWGGETIVAVVVAVAGMRGRMRMRSGASLVPVEDRGGKGEYGSEACHSGDADRSVDRGGRKEE
jgi:hypothetical protein